MKAKSTKQVIQTIGCQFLTLHNGGDYWYFMYDDPAKQIYETKSIMVRCLCHLQLEDWVVDGNAFVRECEAKK